jgi:hypothetical protein
MGTLYELTKQFQNLQLVLEAMDLDEEGEEVVDKAIGEVAGSIQEKADGYGRIMRNFKGQAKIAKEEADRLYKKSKSYEAKEKRLRDALYYSMQEIGTNRIETDLFSFSIVKNPASVEVDDGFMDWAKINGQQYLKYSEPTVSKKEIVDDLKAGKKVPFVELIQKYRLQMR